MKTRGLLSALPMARKALGSCRPRCGGQVGSQAAVSVGFCHGPPPNPCACPHRGSPEQGPQCITFWALSLSQPNKPQWGLRPSPRPPPNSLLLHCGGTGPSCSCTPGWQDGRLVAAGVSRTPTLWGAQVPRQAMKARLGQRVAGGVCPWTYSAGLPRPPRLCCEPAPHLGPLCPHCTHPGCLAPAHGGRRFPGPQGATRSHGPVAGQAAGTKHDVPRRLFVPRVPGLGKVPGEPRVLKSRPTHLAGFTLPPPPMAPLTPEETRALTRSH